MKIKRIFIITLITTIFIFTLELFGAFEFLENKTYDFRTNKTVSNKTSEELFVVLLDQNSLDWASSEMNWSWPWPRKAYGDILNFFKLGNAKTVTFDVIFSEPSLYGTEDDSYFAQACKDFEKVVQIQYYDSSSTNQDIPITSIDKINSSSAIQGNINSIPDSDSTIRRSRLFYNKNENEVPTLACATYLVSSDNFSKDDYLNTKEYSILKNIKTDKDGAVLLRFKKGLESYIPYAASEILQSYYAIQNGEEPLLYPEDFSGGYIFFGYYAPGLYDICSTPLSSSYPGVGIHLTLLDNILQNDFIKKTPILINLLLIIVLSFFTTLIIQIIENNFSSKKIIILSCGFVFLLISIYIMVCFVTFKSGIWIPFVNILSTILLSYIITFFVSYNSEGKQKRYIKNAFKQYLSPLVIEQLISNPSKLKLGGERREISMFFSDIEGFSSISEKLSPEKLTEFLNIYLTKLTDIILNSGGTIDKYEGDAIIAFWNAPTEQKNHAQKAIEAAIECQIELEKIQDELIKITNAKIKNRIGINTGFAVVGNMGSNKRFDYTMLGDSVNLASRLEGINKQFGLYTLCSKETKLQAEKFGTKLIFIEIAKVQVIGKSNIVTVFTPLTNTEFEESKLLWKIFEEARNNFYNGNIEQAKILFEKISNVLPVAKKYFERCEKIQTPVQENFKGIWIATEK